MKKKKSSTDNSIVELRLPEGFDKFKVPIAVIIAAIVTSLAIVYAGSRIDKTPTRSETLSETDISVTTSDREVEHNIEELQKDTLKVIGTTATFTEYEHEICKEDGKPLFILFSSTSCPHCVWIKDTYDTWARKNSDKAVFYHWEFDTNNNTLTEIHEDKIPTSHIDIYSKFNPDGTVPTYVFGCRYARIGNRFSSEDDLSKEEAAFQEILDILTSK